MHPGNWLHLEGGRKNQRELALDVMVYCIDKMLPRFSTLDLDVHIGNYTTTEGIMGSCMHQHDNICEIKLDKHQDHYNLIRTTCHEMVHVKQYVRKELTDKRLGYPPYLVNMWKGKPHTDRRCEPWEREAWDMETLLAHDYIKNHTNHTIKAIKAIKMLDKRSLGCYNNGIIKE